VWARVHLGQYWSARVSLKIGHKLITSGPYKFVRNPIYSGILLGFIGTAFAFDEVRVWVAIAVVLVSFWLKIGAEEKLLLEEFGEEYPAYKRKVKSLIPYVV